jgi:hypothetical protein
LRDARATFADARSCDALRAAGTIRTNQAGPTQTIQHSP